MKIRVVHIIESFSGGSLKVVQALIAGIPELGGRPVQHVVVHGHRPDSSADPREGFAPDVALIPWPHATREINPLADFRALRSLRRILATQQFDALHLHSSKAGFLGRLAAALDRQSAKVIYTPHGVAILRQDVSPLKRRLYTLLESGAFRLGGTVVACSPNEARALADIGVKTALVPNGIQPPEQSAPPQMMAAPRIVGVGRITAQKDPVRFSAIATAVRANRSDCHFVWVGDGEMRDQLDAGVVNITGWVTSEEVLTQLQAADIFLSTSLWEGMPLAALQAMACERPLLLSRCAGNQDLIDDPRGFALGFETVDEAVALLTQLLGDPPRVRTMATAGREAFMQSYTEEAMCSAYGRLYLQRAISSPS